jgi:hypothetical protein
MQDMIKMVIVMALIVIPRTTGGSATIGSVNTMVESGAAADGQKEDHSLCMVGVLPIDVTFVVSLLLQRILTIAVMPMKITIWALTILDATLNFKRAN